jgi:hypothetical protein
MRHSAEIALTKMTFSNTDLSIAWHYADVVMLRCRYAQCCGTMHRSTVRINENFISVFSLSRLVPGSLPDLLPLDDQLQERFQTDVQTFPGDGASRLQMPKLPWAEFVQAKLFFNITR